MRGDATRRPQNSARVASGPRRAAGRPQNADDEREDPERQRDAGVLAAARVGNKLERDRAERKQRGAGRSEEQCRPPRPLREHARRDDERRDQEDLVVGARIGRREERQRGPDREPGVAARIEPQADPDRREEDDGGGDDAPPAREVRERGRERGRDGIADPERCDVPGPRREPVGFARDPEPYSVKDVAASAMLRSFPEYGSG